MDIQAQRKIAAIMRTIAESGNTLGSNRIADELRKQGIDIKDRMVRYYLEETDKLGFTENLGRKGRRLTERGRKELTTAVAVDRVGFISDQVDELAYKMTFNLQNRKGTVILNISTVPASGFDRTKQIVKEVLDAGLGMGRLITIIDEENQLSSLYAVPKRRIALGTVCGVTLNGILQDNGIPVTSKFGGLLEMRDRRPIRFTQIINYAGTTVDPIEIFIKGRMTKVYDTVRTGNGTVGASFREIPAAALPRATELYSDLQHIGIGGVLIIGEPGRPLLDVPVAQSRVGVVIAAGLNPIAAVEEAGISTESHAMSELFDFQGLLSAS